MLGDNKYKEVQEAMIYDEQNVPFMTNTVRLEPMVVLVVQAVLASMAGGFGGFIFQVFSEEAVLRNPNAFRQGGDPPVKRAHENKPRLASLVVTGRRWIINTHPTDN